MQSHNIQGLLVLSPDLKQQKNLEKRGQRFVLSIFLSFGQIKHESPGVINTHSRHTHTHTHTQMTGLKYR